MVLPLGTLKKFIQGMIGAYKGIEHRKREQEAAEAWSQLRRRRVAAEEAMTTKKDEKETEVERGWSSVVRKKRCVHISKCFLLQSAQSMAGVIWRTGDIPTTFMKHEGKITRAWLDF